MTITIGNTNGNPDYTIAERTAGGAKYPQGLVSFFDAGGAYVADLSGRDLGSDVGAAYVDARPLGLIFPSTPGSMSALTGMTNVAYASGQGIGTTTTITGCARANGGSGVLTKLELLDEAAVGPDLEVYFWTSAPTWNNNAASGAVDADGQKKVHMEPISAAMWTSPSTNFKSLSLTLQAPYVCGAAVTSLVMTVLAKGSYSPGSTTALRFALFGYLD